MSGYTYTYKEVPEISAKFVAHTHHFAYSVAGDTITKTCDVAGCPGGVGGTATLTIAESNVYAAKAIAATTDKTGDVVIDGVSYAVQGGDQLEGAPVNVGDYTATLSVDGGAQTLTKNFSIVQATVDSVSFSPASQNYDGSPKAVTMTVKAGALTLGANDFEIVSGTTSGVVGSPAGDTVTSVTVQGKGNCTGTATGSWTVKTPITGKAEFGAPAAGGAYGSVEGRVLTVTDSTKLAYSDGKWSAAMTVGVPYEGSVFTPTAFLYFDSPKVGNPIVATEDAALGQIGVSVVSEKVALSQQGYRYAKSFTWTEAITKAEVEEAVAKGNEKIVRTVKVYAMPYDGGIYQNNGGIKVTEFTIEFPLTGIVLNDDHGVQIYPEHQHDWNVEKTGEDSLAATCRAAGCPQGAGLSLVLKAESRDFIGNKPLTATVEGADAFRTHVGATIGTVTYNGGETAPKYTGDYTAAVEVAVGGTAYTLTKAFSITKPAGGYTSGYEVGAKGVEESKWVSYDTWTEALAAAEDGETIYRHEGDWSDKTYDFTSDKNVTVDLCGVKLRHPSDGKNAIQNLGSGTVTLVNGRIEQAKNIYAQDFDVVGAADKDGGFILGKDLVILNKATTDDGRIDMTVSNIRLEIADGQYQFAKISGAATITGGTFWKYFDPTAYVPNCGDDYVVREKDFDDKDGNGEKITYRYTVLPHEHILTYAANGNVITVTCTAENADICTYKPNNGEKLTLTAATVNVADLGGGEYKGAGYVCTGKFPVKDAAITYWKGDQQLAGAPTDTGDYVAKVTVGDATAEAPFSIIHIHTFAYDAVNAMTIGVKCTEIGTCAFQTAKAATLTAADSKDVDGAPYAATFTLEEGFPTDYVTVSLEYWVKNGEKLEAAPSAVGSYTVKMIASEGDTTRYTLEKDFYIEKADLASVTFALEKGEFTFDHAAHTAVLATHALGGYVLVEGVDYVLGGDALTQVGSPAANTTYTIEITATGDNFTGSRTLSWTIKTPITGTAKFGTPSVIGGDYGTVEGYALKVTDTTKMVYGNNAWAIGVKVGVPYKTDVFTPTAFFYFDSPKLDKAFVATDADARAAAGITEMETEDVAFSAQGYKYLKSFAWVESITLAEVEAALAKNETKIVRTLKAYAMPYYASASYQNAGGIKVTEFAMEIPLTDLVLPVPADQALDAGDVAIDGFKLLLGKGAMVTANAQVADFATKIVTDGTAGYAVTESGEGPWTYRNSAVSYQITYQFEGSDGKEPVHANPTTYTVESETIAFSAASLDGYEFKGWNPASIAAGTTGDQTITGAFEKTSTPYEDVVVDDMEDGKTVTPEVRQAAAGKVEALCGGDEANIDAVKTWVTGQGVKAADLAKSEYTRASFDLGVALLDKGESVAEVAFDDVAEDSTNGFSFKIAVQFEGEPTPEIVKAVAEKVAGYIKATDALADGFDDPIDADRVIVDMATGTVTILPADEAKTSEFFQIVLPKDVVK